MKRVLLTHWNTAEARERAERLRKAGYSVKVISEGGSDAYRKILKNPPDACVIDLGRIPSHGQAVATWLRQQKATRMVPIVFVDGDPAKVAAVRKRLPDATYTQWRRIRSSLREAAKKSGVAPIVPGTMDAYSDTPLAKKLGIRPGRVVAPLGAPAGFEKQLGTVVKDIEIRRQARGAADVVMLFARSQRELERRLPVTKRTMAPGGCIWIAWPKKTSGIKSDLTQAGVRETGLGSELVDYKIAAIDDTWSGLRFAARKKK